MAAHLGTKIVSIIKQELTLNIDKIYYWSDSSTVLAWLNTNKKLPVFEGNRVRSILSSSKREDWYWLSTKVNIADLSTRDETLHLSSDDPWFKGPTFLAEEEGKWEKFTGRYNKALNTVNFVMTIRKTPISSFLPDIKHYSTFTRLISVTAWMKRFIDNLKRKVDNRHLILKCFPLLSERHWALKEWIKVVQNETFPDDITFATTGLRQQRRLIKHPIMIDEDLLCIDGRLNNSEYSPRRIKLPIILDGNHHFVQLLILKMHAELNHVAFQTLVNNFRQNYWMPKMKLKIKSIIRKCFDCKRRDSVPTQPIMGNLPRMRFQAYTKPFTFCGIDYFGPFKVKHGRKLELRYGVLFTCLTTRSVHVEIAHSLDTSSCILSIRRMKSRRGGIQELWSDNGTNFKGANVDLLKAIREIKPDAMENELIKYGINWKNIPPAAPNFGGVWERLIGSFKRSLEAIFVTNRHPSDEVLHTTFCEAEYLLNSRPLYPVSDDPVDETPLTPNNILIPGEKIECQQGDFSRDELSKKSWRIQQYLIECFWKRFLNEYLPTLLLKPKWNEHQPNLEIGRVVFLKDMEIRKGKWPLGLIEAVFPGDDGVVRVVDVRTGNKILRRPVNKLSLCKFD